MQRRFICRCAAVCEFSRQARRGPGTHAQRPRRFSLPFHAEKEAPRGRAGRKQAKWWHSLTVEQRTQDENPPSGAAAPPPPKGEARDFRPMHNLCLTRSFRPARIPRPQPECSGDLFAAAQQSANSTGKRGGVRGRMRNVPGAFRFLFTLKRKRRAPERAQPATKCPWGAAA